jgi:hypothetical protein
VITTLTSGVFYAGPWDTVYYHASVPLTSTVGGWMGITLDHPYPYDPAKSLIIFVGQCGYTGTGTSIYNTMTTGIRRVWSVGGCPFVAYASGDASTLNFGFDVVPMAVPPAHYFSAWCPAQTLPNIPSASLYNACAWLGDTLYMQAPDGAGTALTTVMRYSLSGNAWTTGVPIPSAKCQGTLTACGGKLYFIGGGATAGGAGSVDVYQYTPSTGTWVTKAPVPVAINGHGAVAWGDSVIFAIMGPWAAPTTAVYYYNVNTDTWGTSTAFTGTARRSHAVGLSGNKIYVAGGYPFTNTFYIGTIGSTGATITWAAGPVMPIGGSNAIGRSRLGGVAIGDKFYVVGGNNGGGIPVSSDSTCVWNIAGATWSVIPSKPAAVHNNSAAVTAKQFGDTVRVYCPGGSSQSATTLNFDVIGCGSVVTGIPITNTVPLEYKLNQNYPNPFNPTTVITYQLPKSENVKITVFDLLGRETTVLVNEFKSAGTYNVEFDASALASGVYFYRIEAGDFKDVKKMILLK